MDLTYKLDKFEESNFSTYFFRPIIVAISFAVVFGPIFVKLFGFFENFSWFQLYIPYLIEIGLVFIFSLLFAFLDDSDGEYYANEYGEIG